tara:strand:- start:1251 stop:1658 length:408 start_codon:yes stop_codon:yes gene_type:complete
MGCNTCKQNNEAYDKSDGIELKLVPDKVANGEFNDLNIILKLTTVVVILAALPFILCALSLQLILTMFTPVWFEKMKVKWSNYWRRKFRGSHEQTIINKNNAEIKKREKQFKDTPNYSAEIFEEVSVVNNNEESE